MTTKPLLLDIEISPTQGVFWGLRNQYLGIHQITGNSEVLSWAAKWHGDDEVIYSSRGMTSKKSMLKEIYKLVGEAEQVITYNGDNFDLKILNQEFMMQGWVPPKPYRSIDLLKIMRKRFRGTSNKLDYWLKRLDLGSKLAHRGHQLWLDCMAGDVEAFREMEEYNIEDVFQLENLFDRVKDWINILPNASVVAGDHVCPHCGSDKLHKRGFVTSNSLKYQRYCCTNGHWSRDAKSVKVEEYNKLVLIK